LSKKKKKKKKHGDDANIRNLRCSMIYRRADWYFGTHLSVPSPRVKQSWTASPLEMGLIGLPEKSVTDNQSYLLTPWCRVLLEQLNGLQLVKKFPAFHGTPKVHYRTHKRPPPVSILGQPNPFHIPTSHFLEIHHNIIHPSTPRSPQSSLSLRFPHQDPINPLSSPTRATCPDHLILLDFITRTILGEVYRSFS